jgi:hypothetical protein
MLTNAISTALLFAYARHLEHVLRTNWSARDFGIGRAGDGNRFPTRVLRESPKSMNIHIRSGAIWEISVKIR